MIKTGQKRTFSRFWKDDFSRVKKAETPLIKGFQGVG